MTSPGRIKWLDHLRAIGIFFVVLGHTPGLPLYLEKLIFSFHMPLFFWISGLLCPENISRQPFSAFVKKKSAKLLIPYLYFSIFSYLAWFFLFRHVGSQSADPVSPWIPLVGIFYGNGIHDWLIHNTVLWFFLCMFVTEILFYFVSKLGSKVYIAAGVICFSLLGYVDVQLHPPVPSAFRWPWNIDIALTAVVFYGVGFLSSEYVLKTTGRVKHQTVKKRLLIAGLLFCSYALLSLRNEKVALVAGVYGNYFLFYGAAFTGIFFWKIVAEHLCGIYGERILLKVGAATLVIFSFHLLLFPLLTGIQVYILKLPASLKQESMVLSFVYAVVAVLLLLPVSDLMNRYVPGITGTGRRRDRAGSNDLDQHGKIQ